MSVTANELEQQPVAGKLNRITSLMDFLFLTAKANKQIKPILVILISPLTFLQPWLETLLSETIKIKTTIKVEC